MLNIVWKLVKREVVYGQDSITHFKVFNFLSRSRLKRSRTCKQLHHLGEKSYFMKDMLKLLKDTLCEFCSSRFILACKIFKTEKQCLPDILFQALMKIVLTNNID